jgi:acetylornithine/succinyldiaminopimelate/putrescine aminotransferase
MILQASSADIYTMAKGMGNGFPVAGIIIAPHIKPKHFQLGTTFGGNHLACAAALAVLEVIEEEKLWAMLRHDWKIPERRTECQFLN